MSRSQRTRKDSKILKYDFGRAGVVSPGMYYLGMMITTWRGQSRCFNEIYVRWYDEQ